MKKTPSHSDLPSRIKALSPHSKILVATESIYLVLAALFFGRTVDIVHPDAIEYASIARHYSEGRFVEAINGIWSPLMSWVLAVADIIGIEKFWFYKLFLIGVGAVVIWATSMVLRRYLAKGDYVVYSASLAVMAAFALYGACFFYPTPDLITVLFSVLLVWSLLNYRENPTVLAAIAIGLSVGGGYYTKNYFLYFGLAAVALWALLIVWENRNLHKVWQTARNLGLAVLVASLLFGAWVAAMSFKYGTFTTNPIGSYTISQVGPNYPGAPVVTLGLLDPPYDSSYTAREDPSSFDYVAWSPLDSRADLKFYLTEVIPNNIKKATSVLAPTLITTAVVIVGVVVARTRDPAFSWRQSKLDVVGTFLLLSPLIYIGGYLLVHVEGGFRYLWPAHALFILLSAYLLTKITRTRMRTAWIVIFAVYLSMAPYFATHSLTTTSAERSKRVEKIADDIKAGAEIAERSRVASNDPYTAASICYELDLRCYGLPKRGLEEQQIADKKIDYIMNFSYKKGIDAAGDTVFSNNVVSITKLPD